MLASTSSLQGIECLLSILSCVCLFVSLSKGFSRALGWWRAPSLLLLPLVLHKFVASQLFNHGDGTAKEACYPNPAQAFQAENKQPEEALDYASTFVHRWICHMLFFHLLDIFLSTVADRGSLLHCLIFYLGVFSLSARCSLSPTIALWNATERRFTFPNALPSGMRENEGRRSFPRRAVVCRQGLRPPHFFCSSVAGSRRAIQGRGRRFFSLLLVLFVLLAIGGLSGRR
jgi:hypothetical protein